MVAPAGNSRVYLAVSVTDMRKSIDGLAVLVTEALEQDPFSAHWFVFCNRRRDKLKILQWENNGFWLHYRRLERGIFRWPASADDRTSLEISARQLRWLLEGLSHEQPSAHRPVRLSIAG